MCSRGSAVSRGLERRTIHVATAAASVATARYAYGASVLERPNSCHAYGHSGFTGMMTGKGRISQRNTSETASPAATAWRP